MARIQGIKARGLYQRVIYWLVKRWLGRVPEPVRIAAYAKRLFKARVGMEQALQKLTLPPELAALADVRVAMRIGCPF